MKNYDQQTVQIPINSESVEGILTIPKGIVGGLVIFVHGSGSSRKSPREQFVAEKLNGAGLATLLFDLLTEKEDEIYENRFDISLLSERIKTATKWIKNQLKIEGFQIGYFGASTGAAAAIEASLEKELEIGAIVCRGGRVDLAMPYLRKITAPTLFIVGSLDEDVLKLNEKALEKINAEKKLEVIPGATHLFEEPGALEKVTEISSEWFARNLRL